MYRCVAVAAALLASLGWSAATVEAQQREDVLRSSEHALTGQANMESVATPSVVLVTREAWQLGLADEYVSLARDPEPGPGALVQARAEKQPGLAFLLSFLITGAGQVYNGQYAKGGVQFAAGVVGGVLMIQTWEDCWEFDVDCGQWTAGAVLFVGSWVWSMIDAPLSASKINRQLAEGVALELGPSVRVAMTDPVLRVAQWDAPQVGRGLRLDVGVASLTF